MRKLKKTKNAKHRVAVLPPFYLEVFLFYPKVKCPKRAINFARFFEELDELDSHLAESTVFLNQASALQYSRFMSIQHVIFRAYVEQVAIEGHTNGLGVRAGFLNKQHIHGCFPDWAKGELYIENPYFDEKLATTF